MKRPNRFPLWVVAVALLAVAGCDDLLDVDNPTVVEESDLANPEGPELLRRSALALSFNAVSYAALNSALLSDELTAIPTQFTLLSDLVWTDYYLDLRSAQDLLDPWRSTGGYPYAPLQEARIAVSQALEAYAKYGLPSQRPHVGQMFAFRGFSIVQLAEMVYPGFPLHDVDGDRPKYSGPLTTAEAFERALVDLDSAIVAAGDSTRFLNLAKVLRGRALLGLGRFGEAAAAVAGVPTDFVYNAEFNGFPSGLNQFANVGWYPAFAFDGYTVSDREGGNGLDYASADDPRVPVMLVGMAEDGITRSYAQLKYEASNSPIPIASGIEARLIEAEAQLNGAAAGDWLATLNQLRQTQVSPPLPPLSDPGTQDARVDLLFRERAFWLYLTGHRLGDMRRLITHYRRDPEKVFPTGAHPVTGTYGRATSIPFTPAGEEYAKTGVTGCIG